MQNNANHTLQLKYKINRLVLSFDYIIDIFKIILPILYGIHE